MNIPMRYCGVSFLKFYLLTCMWCYFIRTSFFLKMAFQLLFIECGLWLRYVNDGI